MPWEEEAKLVYGVVFSLRNFVNKLSGTPSTPSAVKTTCHVEKFKTYATSQYRLHYLQTLSGLKMVLFTDPRVLQGQELLQQIYERVYVEYVVKSPFYSPRQSLMDHVVFRERLEQLLAVATSGQ